MPSINDLVSEYLNELLRFVGVMWLVSDAYEGVIGGGPCGGEVRVSAGVTGRGDPITYGLLGIQPGIEAGVDVWVRSGGISVWVNIACVGGACLPQSLEYGPIPRGITGLLVLYPIIGGSPAWGPIRRACGPYADIAAWVFKNAGPIGPVNVKAPAIGGATVGGLLRINGRLGVITMTKAWDRVKWGLHVVGGGASEPGVEEALARYLTGRVSAIRRGTDLLLGLGSLLGVL